MHSFTQFFNDIFNGLMKGELVAIIIVVMAMALIGYLGYEIHWHMTYKHVLSEEKQDFGVVTDMSYTPGRHTRVGKVSQYNPPIHEVYILAEKLDKISFNRQKLYQTVRIDDKVIIKYKDVFRVRKDNPRDSVFVEHDVISIVSPTGREVEI